MEIIIKGEAKEIAALLQAIEQRSKEENPILKALENEVKKQVPY